MTGRWPWNWARGRETIATVPDYTTGTVSISSGGTTVTGSGTTFTAGQAGPSFFIQFQGANDWYQMLSFSSATSVTIKTAYQPTANLVNGTYILRQFFYGLSSSADRIIDIKNWNTPLKLIEVDPRTLDDRRPNPQSTAVSSAFIAYGYDASGNLQISPYPFPNDARLLEVRTLLRPVDMSGNTDVPTIPNKWRHVIPLGACIPGFIYLRKFELAQQMEAIYEKKIMDMKAQERTSEDDQPVLKAMDSVARGNFVRLPDQYPAIGPGGA